MGSEFYHVKVTDQAEKQMREIVRYIAVELKNPVAAINLLSLFQTTIDSLHEMPGRIALTEEEPWRQQGIHKVIVKNYLIYFWIEAESSLVHVTSVAYGVRDQRRVWEEMRYT